MNIRSVAAANGLQWISDGFSQFAKNPGMWILLALLLIIGTLIVAMVPVIGGIALALLWPVLAAGLLLGCRAVENGQALEIQHLWAGFQTGDRLAQLVIVGVAYMVATLLILTIVFGAIGLPLVQGLRGGAPSGTMILSMLGSFLIGLLVAMALLVPVAMAIWFAPTLVLFNNMSAIDAMKQSFSACLRNIVPFLLYGLIVFILNFVAAIPFGLGYLVLIPVLVCSLYVSYKDIFAAAETAATEPPAANPLLR